MSTEEQILFSILATLTYAEERNDPELMEAARRSLEIAETEIKDGRTKDNPLDNIKRATVEAWRSRLHVAAPAIAIEEKSH